MEQLLAIGIKKRNKEISDSWDELAVGTPFRNGDAYRLWVKNQLKRKPDRSHQQDQTLVDAKESVSINGDGSQSSRRHIRLTPEEALDPDFLTKARTPEFLLKTHGYSVDAWKVVKADSNIWNVYSKQDGIQTLFSSWIRVEPIKEEFSYEKLIEVIESQQPIYFNPAKETVRPPSLLEIAPVDTHFGISSHEDYLENQSRIIKKILSKRWSEIVIPVGNDMFHNDDFRGRTSSGREIQKVAMDTAWNDAKQFYYPIIEQAIKNSNNTKVIYVKGNHDESMSWAFVDNIKTKFPEIECDLDFKEHKAHIFGDVFIGYTHGDKSRKNTANIFNTKFRMEIARAKVREIHLAHLHGEDATDNFGIMVRTLPTNNKEDEWHDQNGYVGKNKRFQVFEYSDVELESIHYV